MNLKQAIMQILREERRALSSTEITRFALNRSLILPTLKRPGEQIYETLTKDIIRLGNDSPFVRVGVQEFALRPEFLIAPAASETPTPTPEPAPEPAPAPAPIPEPIKVHRLPGENYMSWFDAAVAVLQSAGKPTNSHDISNSITKQRLVDTQATNPEANVYNRMMDDVRRRGSASTIVHLGPRLFGLRIWESGAKPSTSIPETTMITSEKLSLVPESAPQITKPILVPDSRTMEIFTMEPGETSYMKAAVIALQNEGRPLSAREMVEYAQEHGFIKPNTHNPIQVMYSRLAEEIKRKKEQAPIQRISRGLFALNEEALKEGVTIGRRRRSTKEVDETPVRYRRGGFCEAALRVLADAPRALTHKEITERALQGRLLVRGSTNPVVSMYKTLVRYSEDGDEQLFVKDIDGRFRLKPGTQVPKDEPQLVEEDQPVRGRGKHKQVLPARPIQEAIAMSTDTPPVKRGPGRPPKVRPVEATPIATPPVAAPTAVAPPVAAIPVVTAPIAPPPPTPKMEEFTIAQPIQPPKPPKVELPRVTTTSELPVQYQKRLLGDRIADLLYIYGGHALSIYRPMDNRDPHDIVVSMWGGSKFIRLQIRGTMVTTKSGRVSRAIPTTELADDPNTVLIFCHFDRENGELTGPAWVIRNPDFIRVAESIGVDRREETAQYIFSAELSDGAQGAYGQFGTDRKGLADRLRAMLHE